MNATQLSIILLYRYFRKYTSNYFKAVELTFRILKTQKQKKKSRLKETFQFESKMEWIKLEGIIGHSIPLCLKKFLNICGFDTILSLRNITNNTILEIENHIQNYGKSSIQNLDCCYSEFYRSIPEFKFLPGHKAFLLEISKCLSMKTVDRETRNENASSVFDSGFTLVLEKLIETAKANHVVDKNHHTFIDIIRFFATYVFLICGRSCYEVLYRNLPLPSVSTVCEYHSIIIRI